MISIVCPFYNEQDVVEAFFGRLVRVLDDTGEEFEIICVNDGSTDNTLLGLLAAQGRHPGVRVVDLSRNYGKEAALTAGLDIARGDAVIPIDADLQDPPELIAQLIEKWREGFEVVLAQRVDRSTDGWFKSHSAGWFYRIHNRLANVQLAENVGDFRLMDRCVVEAVRQLPERRRFMKGIFAWVGFRTTAVEYVRASRLGGASKFSGWRLWNLALEGITSFSTIPLRVWTYVGLVVALASLAYGAFIVAYTLIHGADLPGYGSLLVTVTFLGGLQLIGLGVIGEYLGRTYTESKQRPIYIVRKIHEQKT
ncbi:MAG: glycosyltransferase family 2 protein [Burkholderiales bacterium]|nr:glycosyltransferase family 2 protein [Burkholderiales bacterium]